MKPPYNTQNLHSCIYKFTTGLCLNNCQQCMLFLRKCLQSNFIMLFTILDAERIIVFCLFCRKQVFVIKFLEEYIYIYIYIDGLMGEWIQRYSRHICILLCTRCGEQLQYKPAHDYISIMLQL